MDQAGKLLENPIVRIVGALSLMLVALRGVVGLLYSTVSLINTFESLVFDRLWNLPQGEWLGIVIVLGAWIAVASMLKLEPPLLAGAAGGFIFISVVMSNVRGDLPDFINDLYSFVPSALFLVAAGVGFLMLFSSKAAAAFEVSGLYGKATSNLGLGGGAPAPAPTPMATPAPAPTAAPAPIPAPVAAQEAGWLPDPRGEAQLRYWDGSDWTDHTHNG